MSIIAYDFKGNVITDIYDWTDDLPSEHEFTKNYCGITLKKGTKIYKGSSGHINKNMYFDEFSERRSDRACVWLSNIKSSIEYGGGNIHEFILTRDITLFKMDCIGNFNILDNYDVDTSKSFKYDPKENIIRRGENANADLKLAMWFKENMNKFDGWFHNTIKIIDSGECKLSPEIMLCIPDECLTFSRYLYCGFNDMTYNQIIESIYTKRNSMIQKRKYHEEKEQRKAKRRRMII